jgi:hypothetical protein
MGWPAEAAALGQGDVQQSCRLARIVVEQLVEVAHAEEQQHVRMRGLGSEELLHQRGMFDRCGSGHGESAEMSAQCIDMLQQDRC